jgi:hypothetical protein
VKGHIRTILWLSGLYIVVVAIVDYILAEIPIINWLALGFVFLFFVILITTSAAGLLAASPLTSKNAFHKPEDELERLAKTIENVLVRGQAESSKVLEKRLAALAQLASARQAGKFAIEQLQSSKQSPQSFSTLADYDTPIQILADNHSIHKNLSLTEIEDLLSKIEGWLG